jgi:Protein of unknown function (DUF1572)
MINHFKNQFVKGLESLKTEINLFETEEQLWVAKNGISNSAGNLALHLIGNLNHFIGAQVGNTGYVRERDKEFSDKNVPRATILGHIDNTIQMIENSFRNLNDETLKSLLKLNTAGELKTGVEVLLHLLAHLHYHIGQINYYRRLN